MSYTLRRVIAAVLKVSCAAVLKVARNAAYAWWVLRKAPKTTVEPFEASKSIELDKAVDELDRLFEEADG